VPTSSEFVRSGSTTSVQVRFSCRAKSSRFRSDARGHIERRRPDGRQVIHHDPAARLKHRAEGSERVPIPDTAVGEDQVERRVRREHSAGIAGQDPDPGIVGEQFRGRSVALRQYTRPGESYQYAQRPEHRLGCIDPDEAP
jgi:hypothetical protein